MTTNFYRDKNVLVTGSSGSVGTHLVHELLGLGARVRGTIHQKQQQLAEKKVRNMSSAT